MNTNPRIAVFGGGSWATAIVKMLCENLNEVGQNIYIYITYTASENSIRNQRQINSANVSN